jgi:hypothetical protein
VRCMTCSFPQVEDVNRLLSTGTSARRVAHLYGLSRSSVTRHAKHVARSGKRLAVIRTEDAPSGPPDPLDEALALAARARTPRERLRALEQVRAATRLKLRGVSDLDRDSKELLNSNITQAEGAYRDAPDFETAVRGLSGLREAIMQRLDALPPEGTFRVPFVIAFADGRPFSEAMREITPTEYWEGVPQRFRDRERFTVIRTIALSLVGKGSTAIKVCDQTGALVWASDRP